MKTIIENQKFEKSVKVQHNECIEREQSFGILPSSKDRRKS